MFIQLQTLIATLGLGLFVLCVEASPLIRRDVVRPKITSPNAGSVWPIGSTQTVTWDTSDFPPVSQITNILGKVVLGQDANDSLNLNFDHPLAQNFNLTDGSVKITVPDVEPGDNYLIVLFGDSGNTSPDFSITNITVPTSSTGSTSTPTATETLITTPIPITGSTITGGESGTSTVADTTTIDDSATVTSTSTADTSTTPASTPTTPASTSTTTSAGTSASDTTTTSAAWSVHHTSGMGITLSVFACTTLAFVLV